MNTNIWSSSQMAGTGGALKALTKNLANQLTLNRTEMKRVVARVISECHGQGNVGDYNGHMFYVKPERIDMTKQITHSKEAFDEMLYQKCIRSKKLAQRSLSGCRSLTYKMSVSDKPKKSLTGVIIDQNHLQRGYPRDIVVEISKPAIPVKSKPLIKRKGPPTPKAQGKIKSQPKARPATLCKPKSVSKFQSQSKAKITKPIKKNPVARAESKIETKPVQKKTLAAKRPQSRQTLQTGKSRLRAGVTVRPVASVIKEVTKPKSNPVTQTKSPPSRTAIGAKRPGILKQSKSTKQLTAKKSTNSCSATALEEKRKKKLKRLSAGGGFLKHSRSLMSSGKKHEIPPWRNPYQFQGGAGATYRPHAPHAKPKRKAAKTKPAPGTWSRPVMSVNSARRMKRKRSQARLAKDLEREEAIDDPERLEAGSMHRYRSNEADAFKRPKRPYKISARLQELAQPLHRRFVQHPPAVRSNPPMYKPKSKLRTRRRKRRCVIVDSSLGSIEGMRPTSRSGLSPAKRHLTLAFMNKEGGRSPRSPRSRRSVLWR